MNVVAAILYAWASSVVLAIVLAFKDGALNAHNAALALAGGCIVGAAGWWAGRKSGPAAKAPRGWEWFPIVLFTLFALRCFLWLVYYEKDDLCVLSPNNRGDFALHLTYIRYLANGAPFWPDNPIFAQGKLAYAVGTDLFNSLLFLAGVDALRGLIWVGLIGAGLTGAALWRWGRGFALLGFLCAGGLIGFAAFAQEPGQPFFQDYAGNVRYDWAWKSLPLALLVTQRGFLFALPAGLLLLSSWRTRYLGADDGWRLPRWGAWLLYGTMPIFHVHTFLALSFVLAVLFLARRAARWRVVGLAAAACLPATALLYLAIGMFQANALPEWGDMSQYENPPPRPPTQVLGWQPGWMAGEATPNLDPWWEIERRFPEVAPFSTLGRMLIFWVGNFGFLIPAAGAVALLFAERLAGRRLPRGWLALGLLAVVLIAPFLAAWQGYQTEALDKLFLGNEKPTLALSSTLAAVSFFLAGAGWLLHLRRARDFGLRWALAILATVFLVDAALDAATLYFPHAPRLRANALPLLAGTTGFLWLCCKIARRRQPEDWRAILFFAGLYLFFLSCNVKFAPSAWDNTKMMLWALLLVLPFLWDSLIARWHWAGRGAALVLLFFSGFVNLIGGLTQPYDQTIAQRSTLEAVQVATKDLPITETFGAEPTYNQPLLLIGRKLALGFPAHVGSHGLSYAVQERQVRGLLEGAREWRLDAARLQVRYLFFGGQEAAAHPDSTLPWRESAEIFAEGDWGAIYDLETMRLPVDGP